MMQVTFVELMQHSITMAANSHSRRRLRSSDECAVLHAAHLVTVYVQTSQDLPERHISCVRYEGVRTA